MTACEHLFQPLSLGRTTISSRIVSTAHQTTLAKDHVVTEELLAYQEARARGGCGLIIMEAAAVDPLGLVSESMMAAYLPKTIDGYRSMRSLGDRYGAKVFVQLFHGGREQHNAGPRTPVLSSSAVPSTRYHQEPRAMTTAEVEGVIESFARCAALAAEGGLDGIEVSAAHNYLGAQFFTKATNDRTDRFGDPARFMTEVIDAVRSAAPDLTLGVRLTADSEPAQVIARVLADRIDFLHLATGDSSTHWGGALIVPSPPAPKNMIASQTEPYRSLGVPIIATGRVVDPEDAETMVASGQADAVGMNRALITDPEMPNKARRGDFKSILRCTSSNISNEHYHANTPIACAMNPRTGRELHLPEPAPADVAKRVLVVGGGPAGLAAAAEAGALGHDVVLYERSDRLGGQMLLAGQAPGKEEMSSRMLDNYDYLLNKPNVRIELNSNITADAVVDGGFDHVIVATGATPYRPSCVLSGVEVYTAWDVLTGARPKGEVIVVDWAGDSTALDAAEVIAGAKTGAIRVVSSGTVAGEGIHQYVRNAYLGRLHRLGVELSPHLSLDSASDGIVRFTNIFAAEIVEDFPADAVVLGVGRVPADSLQNELAARGIAHRFVGDCASPRSVEEAIFEGTLAVRSLLGLPNGPYMAEPEATVAAQ